MEENKQKDNKAIPQGLSLYPDQIEWLNKKANERIHKGFRPWKANASKVVQDLIDEAMKKEQGKK